VEQQYEPESWDTLCWQPLVVELDDQGKLTVQWKGVTLLDQYQTDYFPTPSQLIMAGRTGGSTEHTHVDNLKLTTTAVEGESEPPEVPGNFRVTSAGTRAVVLEWDASYDPPNGGRVGYKLSRDGVRIGPVLTVLTYTDASVLPGNTYNYSVTAVDVIGNESGPATTSATTVVEVPSVGFLVGEIWDNSDPNVGVDLSGVVLDSEPDGLADEALLPLTFPDSPSRTVAYLNGINFVLLPIASMATST
jgi:hypothetical protein